MLDKKEIGKNLERARLKVGLSKGRFAKVAGVDASQYGRVEKGEEGFGRDKLLLIAEKHGINVDFLSTGKGAILAKDVINKIISDAGANAIEIIPELTQGQVISILANALKDQAKAFADQAEILKEMKKEMARGDTQANMEINLDEVRSIVDKISKGQNKGLEVLQKGFAQIHIDQNRTMAKDKRKTGDGEDD